MTRRMFDSISLQNLLKVRLEPTDVLAGYDDGHWPDAKTIAYRFPHRTVVRITTNPADNEGDCLDVENGDATPLNAPGWVYRRRAAGHAGPLVYCSLSAWPEVKGAFAWAKMPPPGYWVAAYPGGGAVIPPGAVGHQWKDWGPYDESVIIDYLPGIDPAPTTVEDDEMPLLVKDPNGPAVYVVRSDLTSKVGINDPADLTALEATGLYHWANLDAAMLGSVPDRS